MQRLPAAPQRPPSAAALPQRLVQQQMNRQPQQQPRPPNLAPVSGAPGLSGPFRNAGYAQFGVPPRGMMPYPPGQQQSAQPGSQQPTIANRQASGMHPSQPAPGFNPSRGGFPLPAQGVQQAQATQNAPPALSHPNPSHLSGPPNLSATPAPTNSSDALDPNDFPALGSTNQNSNQSASNAAYSASYAAQAGNAPNAVTTAIGSGAIMNQQSRDFGPEDFPALGAQGGDQGQGMNGTNGQQLMSAEQQRHTLLGGLVGSGRGAMSEAEKRYAMKLGSAQNTPQPTQQPYGQVQQNSQSGQPAAWSQQSGQPQAPGNQSSTPAFPPNLSNGMQPPPGYGQPRGQTPHQSQFQPPQQQQQQQQQQSIGDPHHPSLLGPQHHGHHAPAPPPNLPPPHMQHGHPQQPAPPALGQQQQPQTVPAGVRNHPAEQLFTSPTDRWGLLALLRMIRASANQPDTALLSVGGVDLTSSLNMPVGAKDDLYPTFYSPYSAPGTPPQAVEPDFSLPSCYNVQAPTPGPQKASSFSDETLFFMFYSSPRDVLQELSAQELYNRHWRFHKELGMWVTKEPEYNPPAVPAGPDTELTNKRLGGAGEKAIYTYWDVEKWDKERKEDVVMFDALEERQPGMGLPGSGGGAVRA